MSHLISNASTISRKHLKAQYIAAACAIALTAAAVVAGGTWRSSSPQSSHSGKAVDVSNAQSPSPISVLYFVVGSEEDATRLNSALSADSYNWVNPMQTEVLVVNTPDQEVRLADTAQEMILAGTLFQIADLRGRPDTVNAPVFNERGADKADLDARIMAGVVSSEHGAWPFNESITAPRKVSDDALMAGVISSEHAAWPFEETPQTASGKDNSAHSNETIEQYAAREAAQIGLSDFSSHPRPTLSFFLVNSADTAQAAPTSTGQAGFSSTADAIRVFVVDGDGDYGKAMDIIDREAADWAATGGGDIQILDLRQR